MTTDRTDDTLGNKLFVRQTVEFVSRMTGATHVAFYLVNDQLETLEFERSNIPEAFHREYTSNMYRYDPFDERRLMTDARSTAVLSSSVKNTPEDQHYVRFLRAHGFRNIVEMVFRSGETLLGGLSILLPDDPASMHEIQVEELARIAHPYIEFNLLSRQGRSTDDIRASLGANFHLSRREIDVAELICKGCTNSEIADQLHVSVATVKSHVLNVFEKIGVANRASLVAMLSHHMAF